MSLVNLVNVEVLNNPAPFTAPFQLEITFEVLAELKNDLEFKLTYVGSAEGTQHDQTLESVMVGPVPTGVSKFILETPAANPALIPASDIVGLTIIILSCAYMDREFIRVGYYVNNDYQTEEMRLEPPSEPQIELLERHILAEKPRVTRFPISWEDGNVATKVNQEQSEQAMQMEMEG